MANHQLTSYFLLPSQIFEGTKNAKGSTHILNQESNSGNYGLHKWIMQLGKMPVGMVLMLRVKLCWGFNTQGEIMLRDFFFLIDCPLACFIPCFLEMIFISPIFHQWFLFIVYGKCEPGKAQYENDFEMSRQGDCCGIRVLGIMSET